jgi:DNA polymerase zeta
VQDHVQIGPPRDRRPVVRIFGSDDRGVKTCVHVHGIFPYFFVLCDHAPAWGFEGYQSPDTYLKVFREALDAEIRRSRALERHKGGLTAGEEDEELADERDRARRQAAVDQALRDKSACILGVEWVSGFPLYGFHERRCVFIRVVCRDVGTRTLAAQILRTGRVLHHSFQPYEQHVGPVLQAMMDRGWAGMTFARFRVAHKRPVKHSRSVPPLCVRPGRGILPTPSVISRAVAESASVELPPVESWGTECEGGRFRESACEEEYDALASDVVPDEGSDPFERLKNVPSLRLLWEEEFQRCRVMGEPLPSLPQPPEQDVPSSSSATACRAVGGRTPLEMVQAEDDGPDSRSASVGPDEGSSVPGGVLGQELLYHRQLRRAAAVDLDPTVVREDPRFVKVRDELSVRVEVCEGTERLLHGSKGLLAPALGMDPLIPVALFPVSESSEGVQRGASAPRALSGLEKRLGWTHPPAAVLWSSQEIQKAEPVLPSDSVVAEDARLLECLQLLSSQPDSPPPTPSQRHLDEEDAVSEIDGTQTPDTMDSLDSEVGLSMLNQMGSMEASPSRLLREEGTSDFLDMIDSQLPDGSSFDSRRAQACVPLTLGAGASLLSVQDFVELVRHNSASPSRAESSMASADLINPSVVSPSRAESSMASADLINPSVVSPSHAESSMASADLINPSVVSPSRAESSMASAGQIKLAQSATAPSQVLFTGNAAKLQSAMNNTASATNTPASPPQSRSVALPYRAALVAKSLCSTPDVDVFVGPTAPSRSTVWRQVLEAATAERDALDVNHGLGTGVGAPESAFGVSSWYSCPDDAPIRPFVFQGVVWRVPTALTDDNGAPLVSARPAAEEALRRAFRSARVTGSGHLGKTRTPVWLYTPTRMAPGRAAVETWLETHPLAHPKTKRPEGLDIDPNSGQLSNRNALAGGGGAVMDVFRQRASVRKLPKLERPATTGYRIEKDSDPDSSSSSDEEGTTARGNKRPRSVEGENEPKRPRPLLQPPVPAAQSAELSETAGAEEDDEESRLRAAIELSQESVNQHVTVMTMEVLFLTRAGLRPDPSKGDPAVAIAWCIQDDDVLASQGLGVMDVATAARGLVSGVIAVNPPLLSSEDHRKGAESMERDEGSSPVLASVSQTAPVGERPAGASDVWYVPDEASLLCALAWVVRVMDPDILSGWEIQTGSWGLVLERASVLHIPLMNALSRAPLGPTDARNEMEGAAGRYNASHASGIWIPGRHVINLWRECRKEVKLGRYTAEDVILQVLGRTSPRYSSRQLTQWLRGSTAERRIAISWLHERARLDACVLAALDLVGRSSEMAKIFGIDFFSVFTRGSQFRVEAVMLRVSRPRGFIAPSPRPEDVSQQPSLEVQPLILEPQPKLHKDPVIVLDFLSLYPSVIIAHNLCYSTCLGRICKPEELPAIPSYAATATGVGLLRGKDHGALDEGASAGREDASRYIRPRLGPFLYSPPPGALRQYRRSGFLATNGVFFVPRRTREGVLPAMLREILATRVMVKRAMKGPVASKFPELKRVLNARQFALKMLSNVTYGYTAASFSGRMPCIELADSIVQTARDALDRAIQTAHTHPEWKARVVYGDTDSLFVAVDGRTPLEAFRIGRAIVDTTSAQNPPPMELKLEKVYDGSVTVAKKRYVGRMIEDESECDLPGGFASSPKLDVKGLEAIRNDQCGLVRRVMSRVLECLLATRDLSQVRRLLEFESLRVLRGEVPFSEFIFSKEFKSNYSANAVPPPHVVVASKAMAADPRATPRIKEHVSYVVLYGSQKARLVDLVVDPLEALENPSRHRIHSMYYLRKALYPPIHRVLIMAGGNAMAWLDSLARRVPRQLLTREKAILELASAVPRDLRPPLFLEADSDLPGWILPYANQKRVGADVGGESSSLDQQFISQQLKRFGLERSRGVNYQGTRVLTDFYVNRLCELCGRQNTQRVCDSCRHNSSTAATVVLLHHHDAQRALELAVRECRRCTGSTDPLVAFQCSSIACPVMYRRQRCSLEAEHWEAVAGAQGLLPGWVESSVWSELF